MFFDDAMNNSPRLTDVIRNAQDGLAAFKLIKDVFQEALPVNKKSTAHLYEFDPNRTLDQRKKDNKEAEAILKKVKEQGYQVTEADKAVLAKYSGKGGAIKGADGMKGSQYEYYTPAPIAEGMWSLLKELGFNGGKVLDPSSGTGIFGATSPTNAVIDAVELNETSGMVQKLVNDNEFYSTTVSPFEKVAANNPNEIYDAVVTNIPFGDTTARGANFQHDPKYQKETLQGYFILRSLEKLKPRGLAAFIVPPSVVTGLDAKAVSVRQRATMMAEFIGAYRLPNEVFGTASADTMTDVIVFRKFATDAAEKVSEIKEQNPQVLIDALVQWDVFLEGKWYKENPRYVLGEETTSKGKWGERPAVTNDAPMPELAKMLKKFPRSRIDWDLLNTTETDPIIYKNGDTLVQSGQTLRFKDGQWEVLPRSQDSNFAITVMSECDTALSAFENKVKWDDAKAVCEFMFNTSRGLEIPNWLRNTYHQLLRLDQDSHAKYWYAIVVALSMNEVLDQHIGDTGFNYLEEYPELSTAIQQIAAIAQNPPAKLSGAKETLKAVKNHYGIKTGFSAVWKGDVATLENKAIDADNSFEGLMYSGQSAWVDLEQAKAVLGADFNEYESTEYCMSGDGKKLIKTADYYVGNLNEFLLKLDADIETAQGNDLLVNKLLRQREEALKRVDVLNPSDLNFNLFSPLVTVEEKEEFIKQFLSPNTLITTNRRGKRYVDIDSNAKTDEEKLLNRFGDYLGSGSITLAGTEFDNLSKMEALRKLREMTVTANTQFEAWVKARPDIMARLNQEANDPAKLQFRPIDDESQLAIAGMNPALRLHGYQCSFVRQKARKFDGINGFDVGLGKAQPLDAKILTPTGWRLMGDIQVGDLVIAIDGSAVPVLGVYPQGEKEIFEVEFSDGSKTRCCNEHLWLTQTEQDRKKERYTRRNGVERNEFGSVKALSDIKETLIYQTQKNHKIPMVAPVQFDKKDFVIDPYVLGVLLGDGCFRNRGTTFSVSDVEIASLISKIIKSSGLPVDVKKVASNYHDRTQTYSISKGLNAGGIKNPVKQAIKNLGLDGLGSYDKFIAEEYLLGSVDQRLSMLKGLMDTDGYVSKDGITIQFSSSSLRLADDVIFLIQSLGGIAWKSSKIPTYRHKGELRKGAIHYTVSMRLPPEIIPFSLQRKIDKVKPKSKYLPVRYFTKVESVGMAKAQCISIDHPTHLYVTDDFIVTHNTFTALASVQYAHNMGVKKKTCFIVPNSVLSNWKKEANRAYESIDNCLFVGLRVDKQGREQSDSGQYAIDLTRIMENRHSKIFMSYEAFQMLRLKEENIKGFTSYLRRNDNTFRFTDDDKANEKVENYIAKIEQAISSDKKASVPYLEDLGIDSFVFDEAHLLKNSTQAAAFKSAKYLSLATASKRGIDAQSKCWYIRGASPLKDGVLLLTATPITNSPLEIFSMFSLSIGHEAVNNLCMGVSGADEFMATACITQDEDDVTIDGIERITPVFVGLANVPILRNVIKNTATIKNATDVGDQIVVPEGEHDTTDMQLPDDTLAMLNQYKEAFRFAIDTISGKDDPRGSASAFASISEKFDLPLELVGHPFNLLKNMELLVMDKDMDDRATFFTFPTDQLDKAKKAVEEFNALKRKSVRPRMNPHTDKDAVMNTISKKDETTGDVKEWLEIHVQGKLKQNSDVTEIVLDTMDTLEISDFETIAENLDLDLDVTIPPKLAALVENFNREMTNPRGMIKNEAREVVKSPIVKQIIFCDLLGFHNKVRRILAKKCGIPKSKIATVTGKTNNEADAILDVQNGFNASGEDNKYQVILANEKAEVGINLQIGTQAIHHLTIGWTPDSLQQRNGRGQRQGNLTEKVNIYFYDADGTFDKQKRAMVDRKSEWIDGLMSNQSVDSIAIEGGMSREQMELLIESVGDKDAMARIQESMAAKEAESRAKNNRDKQLINLNTIAKQTAWLNENKTAENYVKSALFNLENMFVNLRKLEKAKPTAKTAANIRELKGMIDALIDKVEASCTIYRLEYNYRAVNAGYERKGKVDVKTLASNPANFAYKKTAKLKDLSWSSFEFEMIEGGAITSEWQQNKELAENMVTESTKNYEKQATVKNAMPAAVAKAMASGEGLFLNGVPVVKGCFVVNADSNYIVVGINQRNNAIMDIVRVVFDGKESRTIDTYLYANDIKDSKIIYPGTGDYTEKAKELAAIEDTLDNVSSSVKLYSDYSEEVAQYRTTKTLVKITDSIGDYTLPPPYFSIPITPSMGLNTPLGKRIMEEQKAVIKGFEKPYDTATYDYIIVENGVQISEAKNRGDGLRFNRICGALAIYAKAHGLTISKADFEFMGEKLSGWMNADGAFKVYAAETSLTEKLASELASIENLAQIEDAARAFMDKELGFMDDDLRKLLLSGNTFHAMRKNEKIFEKFFDSKQAEFIKILTPVFNDDAEMVFENIKRITTSSSTDRWKKLEIADILMGNMALEEKIFNLLGIE